jgi:Domain of unknown function (DUF4277)
VGKVNELIGTDSREKINCGEVVKAIILNGLGFVSQPLYLFSNFFQDKAVEHLLGKGVKAEDLNDDKIGRVMDKLYKYGLSKLFLEIGLEVIRKYRVSTKYSHLDSTSFHLHTSRFWLGNYANDWLMMMDLMSNSVGLLMLHRPQHRLNFLKGLEAVNSLVLW